MPPMVFVSGAAGQIGSELVPLLRSKYGNENVVAGIHSATGASSLRSGPVDVVDVGDPAALTALAKEHHIDTIYHLAALLSATGERDPQLAWEINIDGLRNVLEVARTTGVSSVFWPSSIGVFGPDAPKIAAPQNSALNPTTIYGITKVAGELLCNYYFLKYGMDVRCIRYPGLISSEAPPGGGTTDYAVEIFYAALQKGMYECFLRKDTMLPMMYMPDALRATLKLMEAETARVKRHLGYNLAAISFTPPELAEEISKYLPGFRITYSPDARQQIADSWPGSIDDHEARKDWGWAHEYDLPKMTSDMLSRLAPRLASKPKSV